MLRPFHLYLPGCVYTLTAYGLDKRDAVARFRAENNLLRMPNGYAIWE
jgi:hypothetical protein